MNHRLCLRRELHLDNPISGGIGMEAAWEIQTGDPNDFRYYFFQGTSMAAPHVSGAAALLISSGITEPDEVVKILETTAKDLGPVGWDEAYGWGLIDVGAALNLAARFVDDNEVILNDLAVPALE